MDKEYFDRQRKEWENDPEYQAEVLILDLNDQICREMKTQKISRAELARRLGKSRAYVTRMLNGSPNFTMGSLVKVALALGVKIEFNFVSNSTINKPKSIVENREFKSDWNFPEARIDQNLPSIHTKFSEPASQFYNTGEFYKIGSEEYCHVRVPVATR